MSTLLSQAQEKLQNMDSSMAFMQNEHTQTLRGLHDEIHKLQSKCGELTFELHMRGDGASTSTCNHTGEIDKLKTKYKVKMAELRKENSKLKSGLEEKLSKIKLLEFQLKTAKTDSAESLQKKDVLIKSLRTDLDGKSDQLAYLMSKIHNAKLIQMKVSTDGLQGCGRYTPTPPPPLRRGSPRPWSRCHSIDFSKTLANDPIASAAVEILGEQEQKAFIVRKSVPLPAIGDMSGSRSFLSKMKFNRRRNSKTITSTASPPTAN